MDWVFNAFIPVTVIHIVEEYYYPGGFLAAMKRINPRFAPWVTVRLAVIINGLQELLCIIAAIVGRSSLVFSLSVASLLFINAWVHIMGAFREKGYSPGVISGILLYMPLSVYAYYLFASSGQLTLFEGILSGALGVLWQAVPLIFFALSSTARRA